MLSFTILNLSVGKASKNSLAITKPFIEKFIVEVSSVRSVGTIKAYRNTFKHIDDFMKSKSIKSELRILRLNQISSSFFSGCELCSVHIGCSSLNNSKYASDQFVFYDV